MAKLANKKNNPPIVETEDSIATVEFYSKIYDDGPHGRVLCLSHNGSYIAMIETASDRNLIEKFDMTQSQNKEEVRHIRFPYMSNKVRLMQNEDIMSAEWEMLNPTSLPDKYEIRDIISALNHTKNQKEADFFDRIIEASRSQWEMCPDEVIPNPILSDDVKE